MLLVMNTEYKCDTLSTPVKLGHPAAHTVWVGATESVNCQLSWVE